MAKNNAINNAVYYPTRAIINAWDRNVITGAALGLLIRGDIAYNALWMQGGALNDTTSTTVNLAAGTYTFSVIHRATTNVGIMTLEIDGSNVGTIDCYNPANNGSQLDSITGIVISTNGTHLVKFKMLSKNASSSSYNFDPSIMSFRLATDAANNSAPISNAINNAIYYPNRAIVNAWDRNVVAGNAPLQILGFGNAYNNIWPQNTAAINDITSTTVNLAAGTYTFSVYHSADTNRGIMTLEIDGSNVGTLDCYAASTNQVAFGSITGISISTSGTHLVRFKMLTKNASSSNYYFYPSIMSFRLATDVANRALTTTNNAINNAYYPNRAIINAWDRNIVAGNALTTSINGSCVYNNIFYQNAAAINDITSTTVNLAAGTYTFSMYHAVDTDKGIMTLEIDGSDVGTIDCYSPSSVVAKLNSITGIVISTTGTHLVRFKMLTKNASSSNYYFQPSTMSFRLATDVANHS